MKHFVGLDVSLKEVAICVVDQNGVIIREGAVVSEPEEIADWVGSLGLDVARIGLEIGALSRWLYGELREMRWKRAKIHRGSRR
jgi:predicted NBD/HSP70 family sugar kinase